MLSHAILQLRKVGSLHKAVTQVRVKPRLDLGRPGRLWGAAPRAVTFLLSR